MAKGTTRRSSIDEKMRQEEIVREDALRAHDNNQLFFSQMNEAATRSGEAALKASMLINGGAAVTVLAFLGALASQKRLELAQVTELSASLINFAYGVVAAAAGLGCGYLSNYLTAVHTRSFERHFEEPFLREGKSTGNLLMSKGAAYFFAIILAGTSLYCFLRGAEDIRESILALGQVRPSPASTNTN